MGRIKELKRSYKGVKEELKGHYSIPGNNPRDNYKGYSLHFKYCHFNSSLTPLSLPRNFLIIPLIISLLLSSCEKDIDIDYHEVPSLYVVEASVSNTNMEARISRSQNMDDNNTQSNINNAVVVITGDDGSSIKLSYLSNGRYYSASKGVPGVTYTITVDVDGEHFTSTSTMQNKPTINSFRVVRKKIATEWFQMGELNFQDLPNEDNWYFMHIYRNDLGYRWAVLNDRNDPNKELQQVFNFFREGDGGSDVLRDGDDLRIELYSIDQRAYDYLFSMQMMENTGTNPIPNFSGGCLGYFSAHWLVAKPFVYRAANVEDED